MKVRGGGRYQARPPRPIDCLHPHVLGRGGPDSATQEGPPDRILTDCPGRVSFNPHALGVWRIAVSVCKRDFGQCRSRIQARREPRLSGTKRRSEMYISRNELKLRAPV